MTNIDEIIIKRLMEMEP